jgi:hypothetical protein
MIRYFLGAIFTPAFLAAAGSGPASEQESLDVQLDEGKVKLNFRYRCELVDQDGFEEDANARTLRTRLGFQDATKFWVQLYFDL